MADRPESVTWVSQDPRNNAIVAYDAVSQQVLEQAYNKGAAEAVLVLGGNRFVVKFAAMQQVNSTGGSRKVMRKSTAPRNLQLTKVALTDITVAMASSSIESADAAVDSIEKSEAVRTSATAKATDFGDPSAIITVFDSIISEFTSEHYRSKYGFNEADEQLLRIQFGSPVPSYFANVNEGQSIFHRKFLSILGLRNLVKYGPEVFLEMKQALFSGLITDYAPKTGPHKMKYYTGNVVDLDTCVLRCHEAAMLKVVNAVREKNGEAPFESSEEFGESSTARVMAVSQARTMIDEFVARFKLSPAEVKTRRLQLNTKATELPVATDNADRGKCAVWIYKNVGIHTFHVNVPAMSDVYGALLRAPYHLAKAFLLIHQQSKDAAALAEALDDFFENAVSDSCFNAKWKSIEAFVQGRLAIGTIEDVLNRLQHDNQKQFLTLDDDDEGSKELELMLRLAVGRSGYDVVAKTQRLITDGDVKSWHKKIMAASA